MAEEFDINWIDFQTTNQRSCPTGLNVLEREQKESHKYMWPFELANYLNTSLPGPGIASPREFQ